MENFVETPYKIFKKKKKDVKVLDNKKKKEQEKGGSCKRRQCGRQKVDIQEKAKKAWKVYLVNYKQD